MQLSIEDLIERHARWRREISLRGIWDSEKFLPVEIRIRAHHRRFNGVFHRKWRRGDKARTLKDSIVIYRNSEDFDEKFLNSVLVHEMIHQYIIQNDIKDTSTHGRIFKSFMARINREFPEELEIGLKSHNPGLAMKGEGADVHVVLIMEMEKDFYCCVVRKEKVALFERMVKKNRKMWGVKKRRWGVSNDVYFSHFSRCTSRLHGLRLPLEKLKDFIREYHIYFSKC